MGSDLIGGLSLRRASFFENNMIITMIHWFNMNIEWVISQTKIMIHRWNFQCVIDWFKSKQFILMRNVNPTKWIHHKPFSFFQSTDSKLRGAHVSDENTKNIQSKRQSEHTPDTADQQEHSFIDRSGTINDFCDDRNRFIKWHPMIAERKFTRHGLRNRNRIASATVQNRTSFRYQILM